MVEKGNIGIPKSIRNSLSDQGFNKIIDLPQAMKPRWEKQMTNEKLRELYNKL
jgi:hypothetical protein